MITAASAAAISVTALSSRGRQPIEQAYAMIEKAANNGARSVTLQFDPFRVNKGNNVDPSVGPFLSEFQANGYTLTNVTDATGNKYLVVSW
jgi:hypothetical protein